MNDRLARFRERDGGHVSEAGRTKLLLHGPTAPVSVVLYHGLSASPEQFARFARDLHLRGHNVFVPRLPRHGHRDRLSTGLARLSADELRDFVSETMTIAKTIGERVVVAGFSLGGLLTTWSAQRHEVSRAVAIAPFFGISWMPNRWMGTASRVLLRFPNQFHWWDPVARERQQPEHGYPRYATHAIGQMYRLVQEVAQEAERAAPRAGEMIFVTNAREMAVNNRAIERVAASMRGRNVCVQTVRLDDIPHSHDIIEPGRHPEIADRVYPRLLSLIERGC